MRNLDYFDILLLFYSRYVDISIFQAWVRARDGYVSVLCRMSHAVWIIYFL